MPVAPDGTPLPYTNGGPPTGAPMMGGADPGFDAELQQQLAEEEVDPLRKAIELLQGKLSEEPDDERSVTLSKVVGDLYKLFAQEQKERDGLIQGKFTPGALRRAAGGG